MQKKKVTKDYILFSRVTLKVKNKWIKESRKRKVSLAVLAEQVTEELEFGKRKK